MSTAKAPAAPSGRICEKNSKISISFFHHRKNYELRFFKVFRTRAIYEMQVIRHHMSDNKHIKFSSNMPLVD